MKNDRKLCIRCNEDFLTKLEVISKANKKTKSAVLKDLVNDEYQKNRKYEQQYRWLESLKQRNDQNIWTKNV